MSEKKSDPRTRALASAAARWESQGPLTVAANPRDAEVMAAWEAFNFDDDPQPLIALGILPEGMAVT